MKKTKILTLVASAAFVNWVVAESPPKPTKPERPEKPSEEKKGVFGDWLDKEGFITDGPKIKNWIDTDGDRIDDRMQKGPGAPIGENRPDKEILRPNKPDQGGEKPETGGPDPRPFPPKPKPEEGGEKPEPKPRPKPGEGGEKPVIGGPDPRPYLPKPKPGEGGNKPDKDLFGSWLDKDGYITDGPKIENWIDTDGDNIDDRKQKGPGLPKGENRPQKPKPRPLPPKPKPAKPGIVDSNKTDGSSTGRPEIKRPTRPARPELSDDLKGQLDSYKKEHDDLRKALHEKLKALKNPTRDQVKKITKEFHDTNKDRFDAQKELAKSLKDGLKAARPERPAKPVVPEKVLELRAAHDKVLKSVSESKREFMSALSKASKEERKDLLDGFREQQKKLQEEMKNIQRQIRESIDKPKTDVIAEKPRVERRPPPRPRPDVSSKTDDRRPAGR